MKTKEPAAHRRKGRPLSFDRDVALNQAMLLFWQHGYEATSLNDLTTALGVTPSSIYTVFGDKKGLFLAAVGHYVSGGPVTSQTIIDGYFNMMMIVDYANADKDFGAMVGNLEDLGDDIGVRIRCQREEIFTKMHRI